MLIADKDERAPEDKLLSFMVLNQTQTDSF